LIDKDRLLQAPLSVEILKKEKKFSKFFQVNGAHGWIDCFTRSWKEKENYLFLNNFIFPNSSLIWNIASENLYMTQWPLRSAVLINMVDSEDAVLRMNWLKIKGVSHIIIPTEEQTDEFLEIADFRKDDFNINIYQVDANKKFWIANEYRKINTVYDFEKTLHDNDFKPLKEVLVEQKIEAKLEEKNKSTIDIIEDKDIVKKVRVKSEGDCILVVDQTYYPGWRAFVDGKKVKIMPVNIDQQAIIVPGGEYEVSFYFRPESFKRGVVLSILTLVVVGVVFLLQKYIGLDSVWQLPGRQNNQGQFF